MNKILIVEDEAAISNLIRTNLNDAGYRCTCAYDGLLASEITGIGYDILLIVLLDHRLMAHCYAPPQIIRALC